MNVYTANPGLSNTGLRRYVRDTSGFITATFHSWFYWPLLRTPANGAQVGVIMTTTVTVTILTYPRPSYSVRWTSLSMTRQVYIMRTVMLPSLVMMLPVFSMLLNFGPSQRSNWASVDEMVEVDTWLCTMYNFQYISF